MGERGADIEERCIMNKECGGGSLWTILRCSRKWHKRLLANRNNHSTNENKNIPISQDFCFLMDFIQRLDKRRQYLKSAVSCFLF